jgi:regulatory protein
MPRKVAKPSDSLFGEEADAVPIISEVTPVARDPNYSRIKAGRRTIASVRTSSLETLGIRPGVRWSASLETAVASAAAADVARKQLLRWLSSRPCSTKQAKERLLKKGHATEVVARVVADAVRDGWLNDRSLADDIIRGTISRKPAGRKLLESRLARRGIGKNEAAEAMSRTGTRDEPEDAWALARRRIATMGSIKPEAALRRVAGLLARRGFDDQTVESTIERLQTLLNRSSDEDS